MIYGYARISTAKQNIDRQIRNIKSVYPDAVILQEAFTGTKIDGRDKWQRLCGQVKEHDIIVMDSVSRMSRNAREGFESYKALYARGVELVFLKEGHINTQVYKDAAKKQIEAVETGDDATNELMKAIIDGINTYIMRLAERQIIIAFEQANKEVDDLHQRTKEGIETARLNGKQIGGVQGKKLNIKKAIAAKEIIRKHCIEFGGTLKDSEVMKLANVANNTYYKYKREIREE